MEYTVQKLARLAGVSNRTLRFYDEIGLLKPARTNSSGYRIYGQEEVDMLQQILFYRELGFALHQIQSLVNSPRFDKAKALKEHHAQLLDKQKQLERLIDNVEKSIASQEGRITMSDKEKFEGFKQKLIEDNEAKYGREVREKYGDHTIDKSNQNVQNMTQADYEAVTHLEKEVIKSLMEAFSTGDPTSESAKEAVELHKQWLQYFWHDYNEEVHIGLAQMYVDDDRFTAYYDKYQPGLAVFLRDAVNAYMQV